MEFKVTSVIQDYSLWETVSKVTEVSVFMHFTILFQLLELYSVIFLAVNVKMKRCFNEITIDFLDVTLKALQSREGKSYIIAN